MRHERGRSWLLLGLLWLAVACRGAGSLAVSSEPFAISTQPPDVSLQAPTSWPTVSTEPVATNTQVPGANLQPPGSTPTVSVEPLTISPQPPDANLQPPISIPLPTPAPLFLAAPPQWQALAALLPLPWTLRLDGAPETLLEAGEVDAALRPDASGTVVWQRPLALTIPFSLDWQEVTMERAQTLLADGHGLMLPLPWDEMPADRRALRVNGRSPANPAYPFQLSWSLHAAPGRTLDELAAALQAHLAPAPVVQLTAVGDLMLDRALGWQLRQGNLEYPFARVADLLQAADITIGNLESALGDVGEAAPKRYPFRAPPEAAPALALAGFDVLSLANNHAGDYGMEALLHGMELLRAVGIAPIGAGANAAEARAPFITSVNGLTLAFLAYVHVPVEALSHFDTASWTATAVSPGLAWADPEQIGADVTTVAPLVDLVIVSLHSGYEYVEAPSPPQMAAAQAAIDAGAHLVLGHHAHILQGIQFYKGGVIVYGLGNFAFEIDGPPETAILNVWLDANGVRELELIPVIIQFGGQPRLADPAEAGLIRQRVYYLSTLLPRQ